MKNIELSSHDRQNRAFVNLPSQRAWVRLEEYVVKSSLHVKTGLNSNEIKKTEELMDQTFDAILKKLLRQN